MQKLPNHQLIDSVVDCIADVCARKRTLTVLPLSWYSDVVTEDDIPDYLDEYCYHEITNVTGFGSTAQYICGNIYWVEICGRMLIPITPERMSRIAKQSVIELTVNDSNILSSREVLSIRQLLTIVHDRSATKAISAKLALHDVCIRRNKSWQKSRLVNYKFYKQVKQRESGNSQ